MGRERGVAVRVAQGFTNREIAADLFISPKTVEKHLARVFAKLGVSSRAGVAATIK
ncbi:helix-turn-helix transcriptional regulator [Nocardia sp. NPDC004168]|uniref:response regulator transcription factor n=1 Tax=Nocardia sp. NPDC004168 TaxID=3154452 RepID=UPI0033A00A7C